MKGQHLHYGILHFDGLYVTRGAEIALYSHQGHYFLGEKAQSLAGSLHLDLTTQSMLVSKPALREATNKATKHLQRFT